MDKEVHLVHGDKAPLENGESKEYTAHHNMGELHRVIPETKGFLKKHWPILVGGIVLGATLYFYLTPGEGNTRPPVIE